MIYQYMPKIFHDPCKTLRPTPFNPIMRQNPNDDKTMEKLENQITLETLDHLIINAIKEICYCKKKSPDENSIFE